MDWTEATTHLSAPLNSKHVKERSQSGRQLSYIEGWHAIAEANRIFGFGGWTRETIQLEKVAEHERQLKSGNGWGVSYLAKVRVTVDGVVREGIGAGHGMDRDLGAAHESAIKEAETDAMKRALMTFGNPFGLALYDKTQANVTDEPLDSGRHPDMAHIQGNPDAKHYTSNGTTAKAIEARKNNEFWSQCQIECRAAPSPEALKAWLKLRHPEMEKRMTPDDLDLFAAQVYEPHRESLLARMPT